MVHFLREASQHGPEEHNLLLLPLQFVPKLINVVVRATEKPFQTLKLALLQVFRELVTSALKRTAKVGTGGVNYNLELGTGGVNLLLQPRAGNRRG